MKRLEENLFGFDYQQRFATEMDEAGRLDIEAGRLPITSGNLVYLKDIRNMITLRGEVEFLQASLNNLLP